MGEMAKFIGSLAANDHPRQRRKECQGFTGMPEIQSKDQS